MQKTVAQWMLIGGLGVFVQSAQAQESFKPDMGKLTATGGVIQVEGAGGGGLTPVGLDYWLRHAR